MKPNKSNKMAKSKGKPSSIASADISSAQPLVLTQGTLIEGTFDVIRTATEDTLIGTVTNWNGTWWDYHFNNTPEFSIPPGGQGATNYGEFPNMTMPFTFMCVVPHSGEPKSYFFGVSSNVGRNVAGKTLHVG